jgi:hypothetical protein
MGTTGVDAGMVRAIAREYETAAGIVDGAARHHLGALTFGGSTAGRAYVAHGEALRGALDEVVLALRQWSRAAAEIASVLQCSADRYAEADARAAERVG